MSASIDFSEIRKLAIECSGLSHMDDEYTFFYDETNNSRLFRITETDFNASKDEDFVLGGLVYEGKHKAFDIEKLLQSLRLQPTMKEIKRKHPLRPVIHSLNVLLPRNFKLFWNG